MADVPLMTNPMTTAGDIIQGGASGAEERLAIGTAGQVLKVNSGATAVEWDDEGGGSSPQSAKYQAAALAYTSPSSGTSFTDIDGTNLALTITTGARRVMVGMTGEFSETTNNNTRVLFDVLVDGASVSGGDGVTGVRHDNFYGDNGSFTYLTDVLTAASHTFKLQWRSTVSGNRMTNTSPLCFWVQEMP